MNVCQLIGREIWYRKLSFFLAVFSVVTAVGCLVGELILLRAHDLRTEQMIEAKHNEAREALAEHDRRTEDIITATHQEAREALDEHNRRTRKIIAEKEADTRKKTLLLQDDYRKIMKKLGFNLVILPKGQNLGDFYDKDYAVKTMPEAYVTKLADSGIMTVRHLLPILRQKTKWPEQERPIILVGTRGEVPVAHRDPKKPMMTLVERDTMVMGHELHRSIGVSAGDKVKLLGHEFTVAKCHPERGGKDDITIWINLKQAQELLGKEGKINGIQALQCFCSRAMVGRLRKDLARILPDTQVIPFENKLLIRLEARQRAADEAKDALIAERKNSDRIRDELGTHHNQAIAAARANRARLRRERQDHAKKTIAAEKASRRHLREEREAFAAILVPGLTIGCIVWVGFLMFSNVRERASEIGILRALGVRQGQVFAIFLGKAVLIGLVGAALGYVGGAVVGRAWGKVPVVDGEAMPLFDPGLFAAVLFLAPLLAALASWLPAMTAARQDPAVILTGT